MSEYNQDKLTADALAVYEKTRDPRLREIMQSLVKHLHAFAREVDLTPDEWLEGIRFVTRTGQISTDKRPEFILLSDVLGLSMMVVSLAAGAGGRRRKERDRSDRGDRRGAVLLARRARRRARHRHRRRRPGRAGVLLGAHHRPRRQATRRSAARRLVGRRRRQVRPAALGRADDAARAGASAPTTRAATGSGRSGRRSIRCRSTARSARCCARPIAASTGRGTST